MPNNDDEVILGLSPLHLAVGRPPASDAMRQMVKEVAPYEKLSETP